MDNMQNDHLKAYGIAYFSISKGHNVEWLLNYRGGSFLIDKVESLMHECKIRGVKKEQGYLNRFFDKLFDIRNENEKTTKLLLLISLIILYYSMFVNNEYLLFSLNDLKDKLKNFI